MVITEILEHFLSRADWVDCQKTVDRVIVGDPGRDVDRCLVTWMPSFAALEAMVARDIDLLICHEPTFWHHRDDKPGDDPESAAKLRFIDEHDLVIVRNHDCWDRWPNVGIPWAWAQYLEVGREPAATGRDGYQHRYDVDPIRLDDFARRVAAKCAAFGEPAVQVTGDGKMEVSKIGIGTGCACDIATFIGMGCDCSVVCDDGSCYWANIQRARDIGHPVIRVNHGTSEEPGMMTLTQYINEKVDGIDAEHLPHGSVFRLVGTTD